MTYDLQRHQRPIRARGKITCFTWSPNGNRVVFGSDDGGFEIVDAQTTEVQHQWTEEHPAACAAWSSDTPLATGFKNGEIKLWDQYKGRNELFVVAHPEPVQSLVWSPDGRTLVSGSGVGVKHSIGFWLFAWDVVTRARRELTPRHGQVISSLAFSPDGRYLASGSYDQTIAIWETAGDWKRVRTLQATGGLVSGLAWSADSRRIIFAANRELTEWDVATNGKPRVVFTASKRINSISCSGSIPAAPHPEFLLATTIDRQTMILNGLNWTELASVPSGSSRWEGIGALFHPRESTLAVVTDDDRTIELWDIGVRPALAPPAVIPVTVSGQPSESHRREFDVAIVCALAEPELKKFLDTSANWAEHPSSSSDAHIYYWADVKTSDDTISVVASAATQARMAASAVLATKMILAFRPAFIIMVGIAAGTKTKTGSRNYGDILIANESFDSGSGKVSSRGGKSVLDPDHHPITIAKPLLTRLKALQAKRTYLDGIRNRWVGPKPNTALNLHIGPIGSGAAVIDSRQAVQEIERHCRKMIGLEMEIYGVYVAATETPPFPKFLSFKSVCDFAQAKKDAWRDYAAYTAAQYCYQFIVNDIDRFVGAKSGARKENHEA